METPAARITVTTDIPRTSGDDAWAFNFVVFYAHDHQRIPPRDWNRRNKNEWVMLIHQHHKITQEKRVVHIAPDFTHDGQVKGVHLTLLPANTPEVPPFAVQHYKVEEWPLKLNGSKVAPYGTFYHNTFLGLINDAHWKQTFLYGIPPFDSNQFCMNIAHYFRAIGLFDESDLRYLGNLMKTSWPRSDGSNLPHQI